MIARRAVLAALFGCLASHAQAQSGVEEELLRQINAQRAQAGLGPLALDARLQRVAAQHAVDLARRDRLDHANGAGENLGARLARVGYVWRVAAENVALGSANAAEVVALWLASDGHRRNLLVAEADSAGIAQAGSGERRFWVLIVARAANAGSIAPTR